MALLTRQFTPGMIKRNRGHIINISSVAAHNHYAGGAQSLTSCSLLHTDQLTERGEACRFCLLWHQVIPRRLHKRSPIRPRRHRSATLLLC